MSWPLLSGYSRAHEGPPLAPRSAARETGPGADDWSRPCGCLKGEVARIQNSHLSLSADKWPLGTGAKKLAIRYASSTVWSGES